MVVWDENGNCIETLQSMTILVMTRLRDGSIVTVTRDEKEDKDILEIRRM